MCKLSRRARAPLTAAAALMAPLLWSGPAQAFGGVWSSGPEAIRPSAQQILLVDHPDATVTAVVRMQLAGPAQDFAWLIPVPANTKVGVSSSVIFQRLDAVTTPQYWVELTVEGTCIDTAALGPAYPSEGDAGAAPLYPVDTTAVDPLQQAALGPYDYVELAIDAAASDPARAAAEWLTQHGYRADSADVAGLNAFLRRGQHLLAFKLKSGMDRSAVRPLLLTYPAEQLTLPILPAQGSDLSLVIWVVAAAQAVPENLPSLVLNDALIDWLSSRRFPANTLPAGGAGPFGPVLAPPRNYAALLAAASGEVGGLGFVTELAGPASQVRGRVWSEQDMQELETLSGEVYDDGIDAVLAAQAHYAGWDGFMEALEKATTLAPGVSLEAFAQKPDQYRGKVQVDADGFLAVLEEKVLKPVIDGAALLHQGPYLTRLHGILRASGSETRAASFVSNGELAQISNVHLAQQHVVCDPSAPSEDAASWRIELPQGGAIEGRGKQAWPLATGSMPANLKVVQLAKQGSGTVTTDNSAAIARALFEATGTVPASAPLPTPQHGVVIGGTQSVRPAPLLDAGAPAGDGDRPDPGDDAASRRAHGCSALPARAASTESVVIWLALLAWPWARRRGART